MFDRFPKIRPILPEEMARIYQEHYRSNRGGATPASSLAARLETWLHRQVATDVRRDPVFKTTLEIGAGTLNQLGYEPVVGPYDIVEPTSWFYEGSPILSRVRCIYADIRDIPPGEMYDRITSVATFEHLCDLPWVVARTGAHLNPLGSLRASIPSEGTLLWGLGWRLTTGIEFRIRYHMDYRLLMRHEHVNTALEIEEVLRYFYRDVRRRVLGVHRWLSFYQFFVCRDPDLGRCREFLEAVPEER